MSWTLTTRRRLHRVESRSFDDHLEAYLAAQAFTSSPNAQSLEVRTPEGELAHVWRAGSPFRDMVRPPADRARPSVLLADYGVLSAIEVMALEAHFGVTERAARQLLRIGGPALLAQLESGTVSRVATELGVSWEQASEALASVLAKLGLPRIY